MDASPPTMPPTPAGTRGRGGDGGPVWAIVLAAGTGARFGGRKQYLVAGGARLVDRVVATAAASCDGVVVVLPPGEAWTGQAVDIAVGGGATRAASVTAGLGAVPGEAAVVVIADAAHPLASRALYGAVLGAVRGGADAAVPALPALETVARLGPAGEVAATVERSGLALLQTPMAFRADVLRAAHAAGGEAPDDASLLVGRGGVVATVPGEPGNLHVTTPAELALVDLLATALGAAGTSRID